MHSSHSILLSCTPECGVVKYNTYFICSFQRLESNGGGSSGYYQPVWYGREWKCKIFRYAKRKYSTININKSDADWMARVCECSCLEARLGGWKLLQRDVSRFQQKWWRYLHFSFCLATASPNVSSLPGCIPAEEMKFVLSQICSPKVDNNVCEHRLYYFMAYLSMQPCKTLLLCLFN